MSLTMKQKLARAEEKAKRSADQVRLMQNSYTFTTNAFDALMQVMGSLHPRDAARVMMDLIAKHKTKSEAHTKEIWQERGKASKMRDGYKAKIAELEAEIARLTKPTTTDPTKQP